MKHLPAAAACGVAALGVIHEQPRLAVVALLAAVVLSIAAAFHD